MTDEERKPPAGMLVPGAEASPQEHAFDAEEEPVSEAGFQRLLREAMAEEPKPRVDMLHGVQRRIRDRSRGRFYANRWSLQRVSPVLTYLVTALLMLLVLGISYFLLRPLLEAGSALRPTPAEPSLRK
ncbi:MAG: hypothetical protein SFV15_10945 [Polyangiaceae bacterium]|nr:hypothetical protein [Polyangiaceae bacterium]